MAIDTTEMSISKVLPHVRVRFTTKHKLNEAHKYINAPRMGSYYCPASYSKESLHGAYNVSMWFEAGKVFFS